MSYNTTLIPLRFLNHITEWAGSSWFLTLRWACFLRSQVKGAAQHHRGWAGIHLPCIGTALCARAATAQEELRTGKIKVIWASVVSGMQCRMPAGIQQDLVGFTYHINMIYKHKNKQNKLPKGMVKMQIMWAVAWSQDSYLTIPDPDGEQAVIVFHCYHHL